MALKLHVKKRKLAIKKLATCSISSLIRAYNTWMDTVLLSATGWSFLELLTWTPSFFSEAESLYFRSYIETDRTNLNPTTRELFFQSRQLLVVNLDFCKPNSSENYVFVRLFPRFNSASINRIFRGVFHSSLLCNFCVNLPRQGIIL